MIEEGFVSTLFELTMLWMMAAAMLVMVLLAARARRLEREQGLASSGRRLVAVGILCLLVAVLVLTATASVALPRTGRQTLGSAAEHPSDRPGQAGSA